MTKSNQTAEPVSTLPKQLVRFWGRTEARQEQQWVGSVCGRRVQGTGEESGEAVRLRCDYDRGAMAGNGALQKKASMQITVRANGGLTVRRQPPSHGVKGSDKRPASAARRPQATSRGRVAIGHLHRSDVHHLPARFNTNPASDRLRKSSARPPSRPPSPPARPPDRLCTGTTTPQSSPGKRASR
ncbi:hypothetical protein SKAU_G00274730 [Synaphobranchus kaupii]|uniref:Uncharacterized protein n=1 Tax=Synaphobranchus kaupii TaxID=118154 RepID=A0A9Q1IQY2_SYNKA|nr:hypothetical protein SKAU_G00274730 [Synaphobranchus kaupii]